jgi:UDP-sulfoquinovose synthase
MRAIELIIQKTPESGEFRIVNQLTEVFTINELANLVQKIGLQFGLNIWFKHQENPRIELEKHYYQPEYNKLLKWGLSPRYLADELPQMFEDVLRFKNVIKKEVINPTIKWR